MYYITTVHYGTWIINYIYFMYVVCAGYVYLLRHFTNTEGYYSVVFLGIFYVYLHRIYTYTHTMLPY
jgi:hypothetical protein